MDWLNRNTLFLLLSCLCFAAVVMNWRAKRHHQQVLQDLSRKLDSMNDRLIAMRTANDHLISSIIMLKSRYKDKLEQNDVIMEEIHPTVGVKRPAET